MPGPLKGCVSLYGLRKCLAMDRLTLNQFKSLFEQERNKLLSQGLKVDQFKLERDDMSDELDMSSIEMETEMRMRLRNREALFLKKINESLKRIESGSFGQCKSCDDEIELRRLQARPTTHLCVNCKEDEERRELLHIDGHKPKSLGKKLRLA